MSTKLIQLQNFKSHLLEERKYKIWEGKSCLWAITILFLKYVNKHLDREDRVVGLVMKILYSKLCFCDTYGVFFKRVTMVLRIRMLSRIKKSLDVGNKKGFFDQETFLNQEAQKWAPQGEETQQTQPEGPRNDVLSMKCRHFTIKRWKFSIAMTEPNHAETLRG